MTLEKLKSILEAIFLSADRPLNIAAIEALFNNDEEPPTRDDIRSAVQMLQDDYVSRSCELHKVASGYRLQVGQDYAPWVGRLWEEKPPRYSRAMLETLSLIAYRQPITRGEIEQVRGVSVSSHIIKSLMEREWVRVLGHKEVPGKPALYGTTKQFLDYFNLASLDMLPTLSELRDLDQIHPELALEVTELADEADEAVVEEDFDKEGDQHSDAENQTEDSSQEKVQQVAQADEQLQQEAQPGDQADDPTHEEAQPGGDDSNDPISGTKLVTAGIAS